ncbi:hypothetical protein DRN62_01900 [Nanoarchaeota archaeon]|nr:MAG: hypothetical protein DRN62_01900 [Nanoarchaeota archaeon]
MIYDLKKEERRKGLHVLVGICIVLFLMLNRTITLFLLFALIVLSIPLYTLVRRKEIFLISDALRYFGREKEYGKGAIYFLAGCFLSIALFENAYSIPGILVLSFGDAFSSLVGLKYGKRGRKKTLEGSLVFFLISLSILLSFFSPWKAFLVSIIVTAAEYLLTPDNLFLPSLTAFLCNILPI